MTTWGENNDLEEPLLQRYCSDTASSEETALIVGWFQEHPGERVWYEQLKAELRKEDGFHMSADEYNASLTACIRAALQRRPEANNTPLSTISLGVTTGIANPGSAYSNYSERSGPVAQAGGAFRVARQKEGRPL